MSVISGDEAGLSVSLSEVSKSYRTGLGTPVCALDGDLEVAAGQVVAVSGPSGSGKSTLLHVVGGMDRPDRGTIQVGEQEITGLGDTQRAAYRRRVGFVFQRFHLLPALTSLDNVLAPVLPYRVDFDKAGRARELLGAVGWPSVATTFPRTSPAVSSSGWPSRVPWSIDPASSSPMSPPATLTQQTVPWSWTCCSDFATNTASP